MVGAGAIRGVWCGKMSWGVWATTRKVTPCPTYKGAVSDLSPMVHIVHTVGQIPVRPVHRGGGGGSKTTKWSPPLQTPGHRKGCILWVRHTSSEGHSTRLGDSIYAGLETSLCCTLDGKWLMADPVTVMCLGRPCPGCGPRWCDPTGGGSRVGPAHTRHLCGGPVCLYAGGGDGCGHLYCGVL